MATSDLSLLAEQYKFVPGEEEAAQMRTSWEGRMALQYSAKLYKEWALVDLSRWQEGKYGLRWRTEAEVRDGKGHHVCGNVTKGRRCSSTSGLSSFEVHFRYKEQGVQKNELVKVRLCATCGAKMNRDRSSGGGSGSCSSSSSSSSSIGGGGGGGGPTESGRAAEEEKTEVEDEEEDEDNSESDEESKKSKKRKHMKKSKKKKLKKKKAKKDEEGGRKRERRHSSSRASGPP